MIPTIRRARVRLANILGIKPVATPTTDTATRVAHCTKVVLAAAVRIPGQNTERANV